MVDDADYIACAAASPHRKNHVIENARYIACDPLRETEVKYGNGTTKVLVLFLRFRRPKRIRFVGRVAPGASKNQICFL